MKPVAADLDALIEFEDMGDADELMAFLATNGARGVESASQSGEVVYMHLRVEAPSVAGLRQLKRSILRGKNGRALVRSATGWYVAWRSRWVYEQIRSAKAAQAISP